jgi:hypothetical protein
MTSLLTVFVNGARIEVPAGATVMDAVAAADPAAAGALGRGERAVADSRGLPVAPDARLTGGFVMRLVSARARPAEPDAD